MEISSDALINGRRRQLSNVLLQQCVPLFSLELSNEGLNIQVINVINKSLTEHMRQSIQVSRGKREGF